MKIRLSQIDQTQFMVHQHMVAGEMMYLVQPQHIGCKWTQKNKIFRSSLWTCDGELVSAGFPKFTNWGENPDEFSVPETLKGTHITEKIDGSLLIVSQFKGHLILRTRGTVDASTLDNGDELKLFRDKFAEGLTHDTPDTWNVSILFEWVSPKNRIVLNYGEEPDWFMVGMVNHEDYSLHDQSSLDMWAKNHGFKRPTAYTFPKIEDLMKDVELWKGKEGVCVYSNNGQTIHKVKGAWYLALHRMKEALASFDKVVDVWFEQGRPTYQEFEKFITEQFDWELWTQCRGDASRICDGYKEVQKIMSGMQKFVDEKLKPLPTRKDQAMLTLSSYGQTNRAAFIFKLLDGKPLLLDDEKKLLYQVLKK